MPRDSNSPTSLPRWITFASIALIIIGLLLMFLSQQIGDLFVQNVLLGLGLALAPSGMLGILADWLIFGHLIEALRSSTTDLGQKTKSLEGEVGSLRVSTEFLRRSSDLGLEMIYTDRAAALRDFAMSMQNEARRGKEKGKLIIVGSSIKGLLENIKETPMIIKDAVETECELRILLTHPEYSRYRENQEDRPTGAIEDEIFEGIRELESCVEVAYPDPPDLKLAPMVKLYKGTPTCFMIVTGNRMLINPYPYEEEAYKSFCIAVREVEPRDPAIDIERTIYAQYTRAHFEKPWDRNSVPYRHYWLEGPNPKEAWDRDSCYGDVFVVQDASNFYLAVYLLGQRKAKVRGMPTSIPFSGTSQNPNYLILPARFSVRLFSAYSNDWHSLDKGIGSLELHPERRRGKASGEVGGNLLNDYLMLGLFDPDEKVANPNIDDESTIEGLKGQPLPLFYVWLGEKRPEQGVQ
jgi:hypothetical protein